MFLIVSGRSWTEGRGGGGGTRRVGRGRGRKSGHYFILLHSSVESLYSILSTFSLKKKKNVFLLDDVCSHCWQKRKGTQGIIEIENPNIEKPKNVKAKDVDVSFYLLSIFPVVQLLKLP